MSEDLTHLRMFDRDQYEERSLLLRLEGDRVAYCGRPDSKAAAERLRLQGKVAWVEGEGKDAGIWLVRRTWRGGGAA